MSDDKIPAEFATSLDTILSAESADMAALEAELFPVEGGSTEGDADESSNSSVLTADVDEALQEDEQKDEAEPQADDGEQKTETKSKETLQAAPEEEDELVKELKPSLNKHESVYEIKSGADTLKIPREARWAVKASGEVREVSTEELIESYASRTENVKQAQQNAAEKQQTQAEKQVVLGIIHNFTNRTKQGDPVGAFSELLHTAGIEPLPVVRAFRNKLIEQAQEYIKLTPEQREVYELKEENEYNRKVSEIQKQKNEKDTENNRLMGEVNQVIKSYEIGDVQNFRRAFTQAKAWYEQQAVEDPGFEIPEITPQLVGEFYKATQQHNLLVSVIHEVDSKLLRNPEVVNKITETIKKHNPSKEKLLAAVKKIYGSDSGASKEAQKAGGKKPAPKPKPTDNRNGAKRDGSDPGLDIDATPDMSGDNWRKYL